MRRHVMSWAVVMLVTWAITPLAAAGVPPGPGQKLDRALQQALAQGDQAALRVIIRTTPEARGALHEKLRGRGATIHTDHSVVSAVAASVTAADLAALADDPTVLTISADAVVQSFQTKKPATTTTTTTTSKTTKTASPSRRCWKPASSWQGTTWRACRRMP